MSRGQLFTPTFQAQTVAAPRLDNSVGESIGNAFGSVYKQLQAEQALEKEQQRYDLERARITAQDEESRRRWELARDDNKLEREATAQRWEKTFGLQKAQDDRAQKKLELELKEQERVAGERAALRGALVNPATARTPLQVAREDAQAAIRPVMGEIERNLVNMTPEERKVAMEGAINPLVGAAQKALTTEDYKAQEYDRLFNEYRTMGVPAEKIDELVTQQLDRGILRDPNLRSRADIATSLQAQRTNAEKLLKSELDVAKIADGNKLNIGEDGELTVSTGKGKFSVGSKPMDIGTAANRFEDKMKGSAWWLGTDPSNRDFDKLMDTAVKGLTSTVGDQKQKDLLRTEAYKALTPEVLSQFVAAKGKDATTLGGLITEQIRLNREGLGTNPGKELEGLMNAKKRYQELLLAEGSPSYTGNISALRDASELGGLVANAEVMNNKGLTREVLPQPITSGKVEQGSAPVDNITELAQKRLAQEQQAREAEQRFQEMRQARQDIASVGGSEAVISEVPKIAITAEALQDKGVAPDRAKALAVLAYRTGNSNLVEDILDAPEPTLFGGSRGTGLTPQEAANRNNILKAFWEAVKPESKADFLRKLEPSPKNSKPWFEYSKDLLSSEDLLKMKAAQEREEAVQQRMKELQSR
jgi:hypothetical protein